MVEFDLTKLAASFPPPETAEDMRRMINLFGNFMNTDLPPVGAFHSAVSIGDGVTADVVVPHGYVQMEFLPAARPAIDRMVAFLRKHV
jgi:hypothetical protein